jgi:uncharacterized protein YcbX
MHLQSLHLHPLKSAAAIDVATFDVTPRGPRGDRRWLVVDANQRCITARQQSEMVLIRALPDGDGLQLAAPGMPVIAVAAPPAEATRVRVRIWDDEVEALTAGEHANDWLSTYLGRPVKLVHMDAHCRRPIDAAFSRPGDEVSFADGFPLLVISQAALDALNAKLPSPVTMARFRPNLVIAGSVAHVEDEWRRVRVGSLEFDVVKPCTRCVFTTIDPSTARRDPHGEPLRTLKTYRRTAAGITFGMNLIPRNSGRLHVGDAIEVLDAE